MGAALYRSYILEHCTSGYGSIHCRDVLLAILLIVYFCKATEGTEIRILDQLEKISFDNKYHRKVSKKAKADVKKKRTMREKAMVNVE